MPTGDASRCHLAGGGVWLWQNSLSSLGQLVVGQTGQLTRTRDLALQKRTPRPLDQARPTGPDHPGALDRTRFRGLLSLIIEASTDGVDLDAPERCIAPATLATTFKE